MTRLEKLVIEMRDDSDETSNISETSRKILSYVKNKCKRKDMRGENGGRDNERK